MPSSAPVTPTRCVVSSSRTGASSSPPGRDTASSARSGKRSHGDAYAATRCATRPSVSPTRNGSGTNAARSIRSRTGTRFARSRTSYPRYAAIPVVGVGCGLRPEELFGLHRSDVDRQAGLLHVRRRYSGGELKPGGKTAGSVRAIPLRAVVVEALDAMPPRIDTPIPFPAPRGGHIDIEKFRHREWAPALRAASIPHRPIKAMRHTFATWAIESGKIELSYLARIMGTSVRELEDTYFRWLQRTDEQLRAALDAYDATAVGE